MNGIAFIPARGGSKRLRDKNIVELAGKPLIHHTLDVVGKIFEKVVVASDSMAIRNIAEQHTCKPETFDLPVTLTTDRSTVLESMVHLVCDLDLANGFDFLGQFLVTCPLRAVQDVEGAINLMQHTVTSVDSMALVGGMEGVVSVTDYDFPPTLGLCVDGDDYLHCADASLPWLTGNTRSQDHAGILRPNGAVYLRWTECFKRDKNFYKGRVKAFKMPKSRSLDIDTIDDLRVIEAILQ